MDFYYFELASFWGTGFIATLATLYTLVFSKDMPLKKAALFNLLTFLVTSVMLHLVIKKVLPNYAYFFRLREWLPLTGINIIYYLVFTDLIFYLYHRFVHSVPLFWVGHFSHHSGEKLHLSLIVRDNILAHIIALPLGLLGIPMGLSPHGVFVCVRLITFYQAFLHFPVNRDIPILKYFLVTPYNHILHHSKSYEDFGHNFGGILNVWDKLCGTYKDSPQYLGSYGITGLEKPDSLWTINFKPLSELIAQCHREKSLYPLFFFHKPKFKVQLSWTAALYGLAVVLIINLVVIAIESR